MSAIRHDTTLLLSTESLLFGTFVVDESQRIVSWNEAATRTLGYDEDAVLGRSCREVLALLHAEATALCPGAKDEPWQVTDAYRHPHAPPGGSRMPSAPRVQLRVVARDGEQRWLNVSVVHATLLDGSSCIVHFFREDTDHRDKGIDPATAPADELLRITSTSPRHASHDVAHMLSVEHLTPREHEVLELLAQGMATVEIAAKLGISRVTARNHVTRIIEKLGVRTRLQAVLAASHSGLL